jgi:hypothetical protein
MWFAKLIGWFAGIDIGGIVGNITGLLKAKTDNATTITLAKTKSGEAVDLKTEETQSLLFQLQQALWLADQQWWATRWIRPGFAYLSMMHYGALAWVCAFPAFGWKVNALPEPYNYMQAGIIGTYFLLRPSEKQRRLDGK